jgi:cation:H+ antiporter
VIYLLFVIGFVILIKGADLLVDGGSSLAHKYGLSPMATGLTIVAFGTSAPELAVNLLASLDGKSDIALGNILGSNIANILLILGISSIIYPLKVQKNTIFKEIPFSMLAALILAFTVNDQILDNAPISALSRIDGLVLLSFFAIFLYYVVTISKSSTTSEENEIKEMSTPKSIFLILLGILGLFFGGKWIVDGAVVFAKSVGLTERVIGLTIVAIGTSLPELATSAVAAYKKNADIAIGNVVGSNIFNIFWILGLSATIQPMIADSHINLDIFLVLISSLLLLLFLVFSKKHTIQKIHGLSFLGLYFGYIFRLFFE